MYQGIYDSTERVAIKVFKVQSLTKQDRLNLLREVQIHFELSLKIPGVVRMFGARITGEPQFLVLELAKGNVIVCVCIER